jgi:hypothetical protein
VNKFGSNYRTFNQEVIGLTKKGKKLLGRKLIGLDFVKLFCFVVKGGTSWLFRKVVTIVQNT